MWIAVAAGVAAVAVAAALLVVQPWRPRVLAFPATIGPLQPANWRPPTTWGGAENAVYFGLLPPEARWYSYADASESDLWSPQRPILVIGAAVDSPSPAAKANEILAALQHGGLLELSFPELRPVSPDPGATWDAALCGLHIGEVPGDLPGTISSAGPYTQIVVCAWANSEQAGAAMFLNRDLTDSENLLRMIQPAGTMVMG